MQRLLRLPAFWALLTAFVFFNANVRAQTASPFDKQLDPWLTSAQEAAIDQLFFRPPGSPGYAVALIKDGHFAFNKGYGLANLDDGIPITSETSFHLASLSKQFTAAAIALLVVDHKTVEDRALCKGQPQTGRTSAESS